MTLNKIAYFVADRLGEPDNDTLIAEIKYAVSYWRAFLLRQEVEKNGQSGEYVQSMIVPVELVDAGDNCYIEVGCQVLKTKLKVPMPLNIKGDSPFNYIGTVNMKKPFGWRNHSTIGLSFTGKKNQTFYTFTNGFIYVWGNNLIDYITVSGIFADPLEALDLCINSENCVDDDADYPMPSHLEHTIVEGLISRTFALRPLKNEILTRDGAES
jgi:hypothetical protein